MLKNFNKEYIYCSSYDFNYLCKVNDEFCDTFYTDEGSIRIERVKESKYRYFYDNKQNFRKA